MAHSRDRDALWDGQHDARKERELQRHSVRVVVAERNEEQPAILPAPDWANIKGERRVYDSGVIIFAQGDPSSAVMYIEDGDVRLSVISHSGKEAVIGLLRNGHFFGEGLLVGQPVRLATATAMSQASIVALGRKDMICALHQDVAFADAFLGHMIMRNTRIEADLVDQLFNSIEKRLARTLLLLAHFGEAATMPRTLPRVSQELLAEMVGTTRTRINFFMNKFRRLGFIEYGVELKVNNSLLSVVLRD